MMGLLWIFGLLAALGLCAGSRFDFSVHVLSDGTGLARVGHQVWTHIAPPYVTLNGRKYRADDDSLKLLNHSTETGRDAHGLWESQDAHYTADGVPVVMSVRHYFNKTMVIFEQRFPEGAQGTALDGPNMASSGFPRVRIGSQSEGVELGYLNYGGMFVGDTTHWSDRWTNTTMNIRDGIPGGPIVLLDKEGHVIIISAYNNFMASVYEHEQLFGGVLSYGVMGTVKYIPKGYSVQTIMYYGDKGVNLAFEGWGAVMRKQYGRQPSYTNSDLVNNYLGYWTDNGAYYYFLTEKNKTYDETIYDVQRYAKSQGIPYKYVQYDSWFYFMDPIGGVTKWQGRPKVFPKGMATVNNKTEWPVVAHNRWWSPWTPFAKQNGGKFNFIVEQTRAVPMDFKFWDWLFKESKKWGLKTYEQDWLDLQTLGISGLLDDVHSARTWLVLMGRAARQNDITIQYCMSFCRHALQALEIPAVTQIRVSDDYQPGENDWKIAVTSMLAHALRIAPYKDTFWTTTHQPGNPYGLSEPHPALHALSSTLSTGPVGPGDRIGYTNVSLLMRCCNSDGLILKPDKPPTPIDDQIQWSAFRDGSGAPGEVWSTYSMVSGWTFGVVVAADMDNNQHYDISPRKAGFRNFHASKIFRDSPTNPVHPVDFSDDNPLRLSGCTTNNFCLYHTTPVLQLRGKELLLLGDTAKWVPMSSKRVTSIQVSTDDVIVTLSGGITEVVTFRYSWGNVMTSVKCMMSEFGEAKLSVVESKCV